MHICVCVLVEECIIFVCGAIRDSAGSALAAAEYGPFASGEEEEDESYAPIDRLSLNDLLHRVGV